MLQVRARMYACEDRVLWVLYVAPVVFDNLVHTVSQLFHIKFVCCRSCSFRLCCFWGSGTCGVVGAAHFAHRSAAGVLVGASLAYPIQINLCNIILVRFDERQSWGHCTIIRHNLQTVLACTWTTRETNRIRWRDPLLKKYFECKKCVIKNILSAKNACNTKTNMQNQIQYISVYILAVLVNLCAL